MKLKILSILSTVLVLILLSSCSENDGASNYFIHAVSFSEDAENGEVQIHAICEKSGDEKEKCFVISQSGKDINDAAKKLSEKYKDCYFATNKVYFFEDETNRAFLKKIASEICQSNIYPSKSNVVFIKGTDALKFMKTIKSKEDLFSKLDSAKGKNENVVHFFSQITLGKPIKVPNIHYVRHRKKASQ